MGMPVEVTVKGAPFLLCCTNCKKKLNADPDKYLRELPMLRAGEAADSVA
jgi:hypothetical protein